MISIFYNNTTHKRIKRRGEKSKYNTLERQDLGVLIHVRYKSCMFFIQENLMQTFLCIGRQRLEYIGFYPSLLRFVESYIVWTFKAHHLFIYVLTLYFIHHSFNQSGLDICKSWLMLFVYKIERLLCSLDRLPKPRAISSSYITYLVGYLAQHEWIYDNKIYVTLKDVSKTETIVDGSKWLKSVVESQVAFLFYFEYHPRHSGVFCCQNWGTVNCFW